ncbi:hypothetical protein [Streptomyces sp. NPDC005476]|uniref:hypothetical protein n=1 Tax=Streptomyces sp. NPDC005476 TaxID=3156882 RepID=UPI003457234E
MTATGTQAVANTADLDVMRRGAHSAAVAFTVAEAAADPTVAGHYPGFPVLPGLYLVEAVDRAVQEWAGPAHEVALAAMDRCRFRHPVHPGDRVFVDVEITETPEGLRVKGRVATNRGRVADLRLRYRTAAGPAFIGPG